MTKIELHLSTDSLLDALSRFADAKAERDIAFNEYDGWSWDYYGSHFDDAVENAREEVEKGLRDYIGAVVALELAKRGIET